MTSPELQTFIRVKGSLNERVRQSTGLTDTNALLSAIKTKPKRKSVDFLIPSYCNQNCTHCFFQEVGGPAFIQTNSQLVDELKKQVTMFDNDNTMLTIYPREITQAMNLLPVFAEKEMDRVLTNGLTLANKKVTDKLKKYGVKKLAVSLHGLQEMQNQLTGGTVNDYQQIIKGIKNAVSTGFDVSLFTTVFRGNVDSLTDFFGYINTLGINEVKLIRLIPTGNAKNLPDDYFLGENDVENMLYTVDNARIKFPDLRIALLGTSFGPNFYSSNTFKYLEGKKDTWPNSTYLCPWVEQEFVGISLGTGKQYPCFEALSFPETLIGVAQPLSANILQENLRDNCASNNCQYQKLCLGSCRITAFSFAKRENEQNPLFAGQKICLTKILDKYNK